MPDSQTLILIIAATVAGIVLFRLYTVLGRRTGQEPEPGAAQARNAPPPPRDLPQPVPQALPAPDNAGLSQGGLIDIQLADRNFDTAKFVSGAREAYGLIVNAFAKGDREALRPLLSPDVLAAFEAAIAARGDAPAALLTRLADARITDAVLDGRQAEITLAFQAEFTTGTVHDIWTFARSVDAPDPNWTLIATGGDAGDETP